MYTGREGLEPSKFLRGRGLRPRPRNGDDEKKMKKMKEDIEADLDSLAKKLRNFCEFGVRDDSTGLEGLDIEGFTTMWKGLGGSRTWRTTTHVPDQEQDGTSENESDSDSDADMVAMNRRMHKAHSDYDAGVTSDGMGRGLDRGGIGERTGRRRPKESKAQTQRCSCSHTMGPPRVTQSCHTRPGPQGSPEGS